LSGKQRETEESKKEDSRRDSSAGAAREGDYGTAIEGRRPHKNGGYPGETCE
jgi:hypothetical protein